MQDKDLDRLFAEARRTAEVPSDALQARVLADALAHLPKVAPSAPAKPREARRLRFGFWNALAAGFGGGGVLASLGMVALVSLAVGYSDIAGVGAQALTLSDDYGLFASTRDLPSEIGLELVPVAAYFLNEGEADG